MKGTTFESSILIPENLRGHGVGKSIFNDAYQRFGGAKIEDVMSIWNKGELGIILKSLEIQ